MAESSTQEIARLKLRVSQLEGEADLRDSIKKTLFKLSQHQQVVIEVLMQFGRDLAEESLSRPRSS